MTTCLEVRASLGALVDGELEDDARERLTRHLTQCAACDDERESMERTKAALRKDCAAVLASAPAAPAWLGSAGRPRRRDLSLPATIAAAALLLLGVLVGRRTDPPAAEPIALPLSTPSARAEFLRRTSGEAFVTADAFELEGTVTTEDLDVLISLLRNPPDDWGFARTGGGSFVVRPKGMRWIEVEVAFGASGEPLALVLRRADGTDFAVRRLPDRAEGLDELGY